MQSDDRRVRAALTLAVDVAYYLERYPDVRAQGEDAVEHYARVGWRERRDPNRWFSTAAYLAEHPELESAGENPLYDYLVNRFLNPDDEALEAALHGLKRESVERQFDRNFYLTQYSDVAASGEDPFVHYLLRGWREGRDPRPDLQTRAYMASHRDAESAGMNPLVHALLPGVAPGLKPLEWQALRTEFDPAYYQRMYEDVITDGLDPLEHFLTLGWREGRNPNDAFSTVEYLERYPDVEETGGNPFLHYITYGRAEGRLGKAAIDFRSTILTRSKSLAERIAVVRQQVSATPGSRSELERNLRALLLPAPAGRVVSVSHDDYTRNLGGIQLCLQRESALLGERGYEQIHLFPAIPLPCNELDRDVYEIGVLVNGTFAGVFSSEDIGAALAGALAEREPIPSYFVIHSLLGHNGDSIAKLVRQLGMSRGFFWIHDYGTVCTGWSLLRNDVQFCGAPPVESSACEICVYGATRSAQADQADALLNTFQTTVVAPSQFTLDFWKTASGRVPQSSIVVPHAELVPRSAQPNTSEPPGKMKIAFLGFPAEHKGWPVFARLVEAYAADDRYEFHHIGTNPQRRLPVTFTRVVAVNRDPHAMAEAVERLEIDAALVWSICPESFCFTAHEGLAGGAAVVTNPDSGNVAHIVESLTADRRGLVLSSVHDLHRCLASGSILTLRRGSRPANLFDLVYSGVTADLLPGGRLERSVL